MELNKSGDRICRALVKIFCAVFASCFGLITLNVIFNRNIYSYVSVYLIVYILFFAVILYFIYKLISCYDKLISKYYKIILLSAAVLLFAIQLLFINILKFKPQFDLEAIYNGGIMWAEGGRFADYVSNTCHTDYFYIFPNNLGGLCLFAGLFKLASFFGITDYFFVASVFNALLFAGTFILTSLICRRLFGAKTAVFVIVLFLITPPFYLIAPVFYTDSLSLIFPVAAVYLFLIANDVKLMPLKIILYTVSAAVIALGALIKMTVIIALIASVIYLAITRKWKALIAYTAISGIVLAVLFAGFNRYIYTEQLDRGKAERMNTPIYYWLDLGVHGQGTYNNNIYHLSRYTENPVERKELLKEDISAAIKELKADGMIELISSKLARAFGDGTFALSDFLDDTPLEPSDIHGYITYGGENYKGYSTLCTGIFLTSLLLMIFSVLGIKNNIKLLIFPVSVFGVMLFLMFWEINSRYITTFIPFIFIAAATGIDEFSDFIEKHIRKKA